MRHTCHADGCDLDVPPKMFMCKRHWFLLPEEMRNAIWREYKPGQEVRKDPTSKYLEVARTAIDWLRNHEAELEAKKAAKASRQGDLF